MEPFLPIQRGDGCAEWERLVAGNERYLKGERASVEHGAVFRRELAKGQSPYAVIVTCSDSRICPEILFDEHLGRLFVVRTAGNVLDAVALGSVEYAVEHLRCPLVVIMGHESCGAMKAALAHQGEPEGNIGEILRSILPSVQAARKEEPTKTEDLLLRSTLRHVGAMARCLVERSSVLRELFAEGKLQILGAYHGIQDGSVRALGALPR